jgi:hypothetical protein
MDPVFRTVIVSTIEGEAEQKKVNDKDLAEFYVTGLGLKIGAWGDLAAKVPGPGALVLIEGRIRTRSYQYEGKDRTSTEIVASSIENLSPADAIPDDDLGF